MTSWGSVKKKRESERNQLKAADEEVKEAAKRVDDEKMAEQQRQREQQERAVQEALAAKAAEDAKPKKP